MEEFRYRSYGYGAAAAAMNHQKVNVRTRSPPSFDYSPRKELVVSNFKVTSKYHKYSSSSSSSSSVVSWWNDPELKRKRRVASYKFYAAEGKLKHSLKKGFRWLKIKCIRIVRKL
ncbi:DUF3511 domain protein [Quillaja saponaria]|uniref:DUF3511 domain protein n=1 Tax=Quillaja saponaria TaxID=32244 RepID=A0AAD7Q1V7_QUISA|nr:DUF3511 domain protein [Quillaja saponaria]